MLSQDISCGLHLPGGKNEKEYFPGDAELYTTDWVEGGGGCYFLPVFHSLLRSACIGSIT